MTQLQTEASALPQALAGIRVLDFTWVYAGPWGTRWLGALGAEVIKVEWLQTPNTRGGEIAAVRVPEGFPVTQNTSGHFNDTNHNKLSITISPRTPRGLDLVKRLIAVSDVVIENFSYGVMERWGLGLDEMRKLKPDIVYISQSGFGHTGRNRDYNTMGPVAQALSGLTYLSGLPGQQPAGWGWSYLDDFGGMYITLSTLAALYHRNVTGQGQHVDQSQFITGIGLNGSALLDITVNGRVTRREGYPPGNRAHWPGTPLVNNYRGPTTAPHNAYRTSPGGYNDWCTIACFSDEEWRRLVEVMGSPAWATGEKFATLGGRLVHQEELDQGIEAWTKTLRKYDIMERCQAAGVRAMPVQSNEDRAEYDPQLRHREMYKPPVIAHALLGVWPTLSAPFKMSETPAVNRQASPLIGQHNREVFEGLLGISHEELVEGYTDGTFWPNGVSMEPYPYIKDIIEATSPIAPVGEGIVQTSTPAPTRSPSATPAGPFTGLRVLELSDEKGQWAGKLMADLGADVIKIEPPGGEATRTVGPFLQDLPHRERSLSFWHYNTSKRGITLNLGTEDGRRLFRQMAEKADVILETFRPGYMESLGLGYEDLKKGNPGLIMCSLTPFGKTGPWKDYATSDLLHLAAGGQMASCGYEEEDVADAPPIAGGGGQAWLIAGHWACIALGVALVHRTVTGRGQYIDASVHDSCVLTTQFAMCYWIYSKKVVRRWTGRGHYPTPTARTQHLTKDDKYVNAGIVGGRMNADRLRVLADWMDGYGLAGDLLDEKYKDQETITENQSHIVQLVTTFFLSLTRDEIYHEGQQRGFEIGAVRAPEELFKDPHLDDRGYWTEVEHPELGRSITYPGSAAIWSESPWRISRRAPLIGEHNEEILCGELGLTRSELAVMAEGGVV